MERGQVTVYKLRFQRGGLRDEEKLGGGGTSQSTFNIECSPLITGVFHVTLAPRDILNLPDLLSLARLGGVYIHM